MGVTMFRKLFPVVSVCRRPAHDSVLPRQGGGTASALPGIGHRERASPEGQQQWMDALKNLGITNLRIRSARPGDEPTIMNRGTDDNPRYAVIGVLAQGQSAASSRD